MVRTAGTIRQCIIINHNSIYCFASSLTGALLLQSSFLMVVRIATRLHVLPSSLPMYMFTKMQNAQRRHINKSQQFGIWQQQKTTKMQVQTYAEKGTHIRWLTQTHTDHFAGKTCHSHYPEVLLSRALCCPAVGACLD